MSWAAQIPDGSLVAVDTAPFIYFIESNPKYAPLLRRFFTQDLALGRIRALTSVVTLAEVLVRPLAENRPDLVSIYDGFLRSAPGLAMFEIDMETARRAAEIRAASGVRLPDAMQLACAAVRGASHFLCNDARLKGKAGLTVICLDDCAQ